MSIKTDFMAVAASIGNIASRGTRINAWSKMKTFANDQLNLESEELNRLSVTDQDIIDAKANADIDL